MQPPHAFSPGQCVSEDVARRFLKECGRNVRIYEGARLLPPNRIAIGDASQIDEGVFIFAGLGVRIGRHVHLAFYSSISGGGQCDIGDFAGIGAGTRIITGTELVDGDGLTNPTVPDPFRRVHRGKVVIGPHAVLFTHCVVLPDVIIGEGAVAAAGSIVHHDLKPWRIYAGNPLVQIGARNPEPILEKAKQI